MKLIGRAVNDVLSEFRGPQVGWNYAGADPAGVEVRVNGTGAVKVQVNTTTIFASNSNDMNPIDKTMMPDPTEWSDVGAAINEASGIVLRTTVPDANRRWFRVIVSSTGTGTANFGGKWAKY